MSLLNGQIRSSWKVTGNDVVWSVTIPANTSGRLQVAATNASAFSLEGTSLAESKRLTSTGKDVFELPAGSYSFKARLGTQTAVASTGRL